mmetsp:Transcript_6057/g.9007  ORF Transcript_6057/g.9007 Transcript_6057/m.9007 type:complete len:113 (-) Transcript_6057:670-1008(-)
MKRGGKEEEEMYNEEKNKDAITNDKMCIPRHHALNRNFYCKKSCEEEKSQNATCTQVSINNPFSKYVETCVCVSLYICTRHVLKSIKKTCIHHSKNTHILCIPYLGTEGGPG